jgi:hypothetical protein
MEAAPLFESANLGALANPKVRVVRSDAYRALLRSEQRFDVIVSEPSNPWMAGVEMLYSREFLEAARSRLRPGGVYLQWFHTYETDDRTVALVLRTFASVFPDVSIWYALAGDLFIVGRPELQGRVELSAVARRASRPDVAAGLKRCGVDGFVELVAHELLPPGVLHAAPFDGPLHTLLHPRLTYQAGRAFFAGGEGHLPETLGAAAARIGAERSLLQQLTAQEGGVLSDATYSHLVQEACSHLSAPCTAFLADWARARPGSPHLARWLSTALETRDGERIETSAVAELDALLAGRLFDPPQPVSLEQANRATELFRKYHHHGVRFEPAALLGVWDRCRSDGAREACREGRREAEALLGAAAQGG